MFSVPGSKSNYQPIFNLATGEAECDCADFQFRGHERPCKHIRRIIIATQEIVTAQLPVLSELATEEARYRALVAHKETLARTVMPANANPAQVNAFILLCARYGLDPFTGEAWAFPKPGGGIGFMPGYRAYLRRAQDHPEFEFIRFGVVMKGEPCTVNIATGEVSHEALIDDSDAKPIGAWWQAKRKGAPQMAGRVLLKNVMGKSGAWQTHPVQMLRKCALQEACLTVFGLTPPMVVGGGDDDEIDFDKETGEIQAHHEPDVIEAEIVAEDEPTQAGPTPEQPTPGPTPDDNSPEMVPDGTAPSDPDEVPKVIQRAVDKATELVKDLQFPPFTHSAWLKVLERLGITKPLDLTDWNRLIDWLYAVKAGTKNKPDMFVEWAKIQPREDEYDPYTDPENQEKVAELKESNEREVIAEGYLQSMKLTKPQEIRVKKFSNWVDMTLTQKLTEEVLTAKGFVEWIEAAATQVTMEVK